MPETGERRPVGRKRRERLGRARKARRAAAAPDAAPDTQINGGEARPRELRVVAEPDLELTLDLRWSSGGRALSRVTTALDKIADDVTLVILLPDRPEFVPLMPQLSQTLRARGYATDTSRTSQGNQRLRARPRRRGDGARHRPPSSIPSSEVAASAAAAPGSPALIDSPEDSAGAGQSVTSPND